MRRRILPLACAVVLAIGQQRPADAHVPSKQGLRFGRAICVLPDIDGDGTRDFAVSATLGPDGVCWAGTVHLFSGRELALLRSFDGPWHYAAVGLRMEWLRRGAEGGALLLESDVRSGHFVITLDGELLHWFEPECGLVLAAGDWDGDGYEDFAAARDGRGRIVSGRDGEDLDGDGRPDIVVGAPHNALTPAGIYALSVGNAEPLWSIEEWERRGRNSNVGTAIAFVEDRDGDGVRDLLVGGADYWWHGGVHRSGNLRLLSGATGTELWFFGEDELPLR